MVKNASMIAKKLIEIHDDVFSLSSHVYQSDTNQYETIRKKMIVENSLLYVILFRLIIF